MVEGAGAGRKSEANGGGGFCCVEDELISPAHHEKNGRREEVWLQFIDFVCKPEPLTGTNLGRMGK